MKIKTFLSLCFTIFLIIPCKANSYDRINRYDTYNRGNVKKQKYTGHYKVGEPYTIFGITYYPREEESYEEIGVASWYGKEFYGKKTANGEIYDMYDITAAHRTLPLPSIVKVTNLQNQKSIIVRINDRGPFAKDRIIDLSKASAKKLGFYEAGTVQVKVELLPKETQAMLRQYGLRD
jgi:rare lipoprotein A